MPASRPALYATPPTDSLSERELEVLYWLASGASNREIGELLYITESTVKRHVYNIFAKLNVRNRTEATLQAIKLGVGSSSGPGSYLPS
jgi:two-component system response regulator DegU